MPAVIPAPYRILIAFAAALTAFLVVLKIVLPAFDEIQAQLAERERKESALATREQEMFALRNFAVQLSSLPASSRDRLNAALPTAQALAPWLSSLETIAGRSGVVIDALEQKAVEDTGELKKIGFSVRLRGTYANLRLFLALLGSNLRLTDVVDMRLEASDFRSPDPVIQASLSLAVYYQL